VKRETIKIPVEKTALSPNLSTRTPEIKPEANRVIANAETIKPIAALLTPKDFAKTGIAGMTIPKPTATKKEAATSTETSRGRSLNGDLLLIDGAVYLFECRWELVQGWLRGSIQA
jgi:hypothetical protein